MYLLKFATRHMSVSSLFWIQSTWFWAKLKMEVSCNLKFEQPKALEFVVNDDSCLIFVNNTNFTQKIFKIRLFWKFVIMLESYKKPLSYPQIVLWYRRTSWFLRTEIFWKNRPKSLKHWYPPWLPFCMILRQVKICNKKREIYFLFEIVKNLDSNL